MPTPCLKKTCLTIAGGASSPASQSASVTPTSSTAPVTTRPPSSSHTKAIVGGVVGGLAGLALLIGALYILIRRRQKNSGQVQYQGVAAVEQPERKNVPLVSSMSTGKTTAAALKPAGGGREELRNTYNSSMVDGALAGSGRPTELQTEGRYGLRPEELDEQGRYMGELQGDGSRGVRAELPWKGNNEG